MHYLELEIVKQNCFNAGFVKEYQSIHTVMYINARLYNPISRKVTLDIFLFVYCTLVC